jgi:proteic killer suppression protein
MRTIDGRKRIVYAVAPLAGRHPAAGVREAQSDRCGDAARRSAPARLEALKGDRAGQWSSRVNDQWRVCFCWLGADADDVEIADYH